MDLWDEITAICPPLDNRYLRQSDNRYPAALDNGYLPGPWITAICGGVGEERAP